MQFKALNSENDRNIRRIKSDIVNLPMNGNEVDYPFMDTIISGIKKRIIANLKSFIDKEHQAYLEVTK